LIRENKIHQIPSIMQTSQGSGMKLMEQALMDLANEGKITRETAIEKSGNPGLFDQLESGPKKSAYGR